MSKETPAKVVKGSNSKNRKFNNGPNKSAEGVGPLNDVQVYNREKGEWYTIPGLTDEQKIAEGYQAPHAWKGEKAPVAEGETFKGGTVGRFQLSKTDREQLKAAMVASAKVERTRVVKHPESEAKHTLIVHLVNYNRKSDHKDFKAVIPPAVVANPKPVGFKTTYAFKDVKASEISDVMGTIIRLNRNKPDDHVLNYVLKYYYDGVEYSGRGKRKN